MPGQQLHDHDLHGAAILRAWHNGEPVTVWTRELLRLGTLPDGRWWITWTSTTHRPPLAYPTEDEALAAVNWVIGHSHYTWAETQPR